MNHTKIDKHPTESTEEQLFSVASAARRLGISKRTVRRMIADGRINHIRLGRCVRIAAAELNRIVKGAIASNGASYVSAKGNDRLVKPQCP